MSKRPGRSAQIRCIRLHFEGCCTPSYCKLWNELDNRVGVRIAVLERWIEEVALERMRRTVLANHDRRHKPAISVWKQILEPPGF